MDYSLTSDQEKLINGLDEWLDNCGFSQEYFNECEDSGTYPLDYYKAVYDSPFGKMGLPEAIGGTPSSLSDLALLCMRYGERGFPYNVGKTIGPIDIANFGTPEQLAQCREAVETGNVAYSMCFTEPQAGSDSANYQTTATPKGDKVVINGQKAMIMNAGFAPYMLVIARDTDIVGEKPFKSMSTYIVPANTPGITIKPLRSIACNMYRQSDIVFDNVEIDASSRLGEKGAGFKVMMSSMEIERTLLGADNYAKAYQAYDIACHYAKERVQFGKPIGEYQLIAERIVDMRIKLDTMRSMVLQAAWKKDNGMSLRVESSLVKLYTARSAFAVADSAYQIMGGRAFYEDCKVSKLWRDTRQARVSGGSDEMMIRGAAKVILRDM